MAHTLFYVYHCDIFKFRFDWMWYCANWLIIMISLTISISVHGGLDLFAALLHCCCSLVPLLRTLIAHRPFGRLNDWHTCIRALLCTLCVYYVYMCAVVYNFSLIWYSFYVTCSIRTAEFGILKNLLHLVYFPLGQIASE